MPIVLKHPTRRASNSEKNYMWYIYIIISVRDNSNLVIHNDYFKAELGRRQSLHDQY